MSEWCLYAFTTPSGFMKIGVTTGHPDARLRQLQIGNHERLHREIAVVLEECDPYVFEREVHFHLNDVWVGGEWFRADRMMAWWAIKCATAKLKYPKVYVRWLRTRRRAALRAPRAAEGK